MDINIIELKGTISEQITQLEQVKDQLYREYFKTEFLEELFKAVEEHFPYLAQIIGRINYEAVSDYDDSIGYYDYVNNIDFFDADDNLINLKELVEKEDSPLKGLDYLEIEDFFRELLHDAGIEKLQSYASLLINPRYKERYPYGQD